MATSEQIKALLNSYVDEDKERFLSIALQVAAREAKKGHLNLAKDLKNIVERAKTNSIKTKTIPLVNNIKGTEDLFSISHPSLKLNSLIVSSELKDKLTRVILEQRNIVKIKNHGLSPRRKLLLAGPPGTGKTFTASILAGELNFPLFQVKLEAIITKFMGESSVKLRQVFDIIKETRGVYFFDEFDTLGSQRSSTNDVGEARRILNSFLQMIEQDQSNSLIICATNHIEILDYALFRRFDDVLQYKLPSDEEIITLFRNRLLPHVAKNFPWSKLPQKAKGLSNADIIRVAEDSIKEILIHNKNKITMSILEKSIKERYHINNQI